MHFSIKTIHKTCNHDFMGTVQNSILKEYAQNSNNRFIKQIAQF